MRYGAGAASGGAGTDGGASGIRALPALMRRLPVPFVNPDAAFSATGAMIGPASDIGLAIGLPHNEQSAYVIKCFGIVHVTDADTCVSERLLGWDDLHFIEHDYSAVGCALRTDGECQIRRNENRSSSIKLSREECPGLVQVSASNCRGGSERGSRAG